jgi:hypothetical protein
VCDRCKLKPVSLVELDSEPREESPSQAPYQEDEAQGAVDSRFLELLEQASKSLDDGSNLCVICLGSLAEGTPVVVECGKHFFHNACINLAKEQKLECPVCRHALKKNGSSRKGNPGYKECSMFKAVVQANVKAQQYMTRLVEQFRQPARQTPKPDPSSAAPLNIQAPTLIPHSAAPQEQPALEPQSISQHSSLPDAPARRFPLGNIADREPDLTPEEKLRQRQREVQTQKSQNDVSRKSKLHLRRVQEPSTEALCSRLNDKRNELLEILVTKFGIEAGAGLLGSIAGRSDLLCLTPKEFNKVSAQAGLLDRFLLDKKNLDGHSSSSRACSTRCYRNCPAATCISLLTTLNLWS